jgi:hypothetical protein
VRQAYRELEERIEHAPRDIGAKTASVRAAIEAAPTTFTAAEIAAACPAVSSDLVRLVLRQLRDDGVLKSGKGRGAKWTKARKRRGL